LPSDLPSEATPTESSEPLVARDQTTESGSLDGVRADLDGVVADFDGAVSDLDGAVAYLQNSPSGDTPVVHMAKSVMLPSAKDSENSVKAESSVEVTDEPAMTDFVGPAFVDVTDEPANVALESALTVVTAREPRHSVMMPYGPASTVVSDVAVSDDYRPVEGVEREGHADDAPLTQEPAEPIIAVARGSTFVEVDGLAGVSDDVPLSETAENVRNADGGPPVQEPAEPTIVMAQEPTLDDTDEEEPATEESEEADDSVEVSADDGLYEDGLKSIRDLSADIRPGEGEMPENAAAAKFSREGQVRHMPGTNRPWPLYEFWWEAPAVGHRPLYFEEVNLERYGYSHGVIQPLLSGAHFFGKIPALPYMMTAESPCDYVYTLGHYRPGSYAPHHIHHPPLSLRAAAVEAAAVTGLIFAIP